jgi:zinc transporter ZupT
MIPFLYASITSLASITGGALALYSRLRLVEKRYQIAFAGGAMVSIALFDLIPEMQTHNAIALLAGFFGIYLLEKLVLFHACREEECETHTLGWTALIGIAIESDRWFRDCSRFSYISHIRIAARAGCVSSRSPARIRDRSDYAADRL